MANEILKAEILKGHIEHGGAFDYKMASFVNSVQSVTMFERFSILAAEFPAYDVLKETDDIKALIRKAALYASYILAFLQGTPKFYGVPDCLMGNYRFYQQAAQKEASYIETAWAAKTVDLVKIFHPEYPHRSNSIGPGPYAPEYIDMVMGKTERLLSEMLVGVAESAMRAWDAEANFWQLAEVYEWGASSSHSRIQQLEREVKEAQQYKADAEKKLFPPLEPNFDYPVSFWADRHNVSRQTVTHHISSLRKRYGEKRFPKGDCRISSDDAVMFDNYLKANARLGARRGKK